jgi:hypothetical protein
MVTIEINAVPTTIATPGFLMAHVCYGATVECRD